MTLVHRIKISAEELEVIRLVEKNAIQLRQLAETDGVREDDVYKLLRHIEWLYAQVGFGASVETKTFGQRRGKRKHRDSAATSTATDMFGKTGWRRTEFMR